MHSSCLIYIYSLILCRVIFSAQITLKVLCDFYYQGFAHCKVRPPWFFVFAIGGRFFSLASLNSPTVTKYIFLPRERKLKDFCKLEILCIIVHDVVLAVIFFSILKSKQQQMNNNNSNSAIFCQGGSGLGLISLLQNNRFMIDEMT